ncbi:hypothetical protein TNCV_3332852 [Trichonephila clavipes]|nr:hypothetical protein TNCV_3332852 [Trichonephila clavipes]
MCSFYFVFVVTKTYDENTVHGNLEILALHLLEDFKDLDILKGFKHILKDNLQRNLPHKRMQSVLLKDVHVVSDYRWHSVWRLPTDVGMKVACLGEKDVGFVTEWTEGEGFDPGESVVGSQARRSRKRESPLFWRAQICFWMERKRNSVGEREWSQECGLGKKKYKR